MVLEHLAPLRGLSLLLAEDDAVMRAYMAGILKEYVWEVLAVESGELALEVYHRQPVHIAILDITMPGISGLEVAARIRERDMDLPILILTSHTRTAFIREAVSLRLLDYLFKPLEIHQLETALDRCVDELRTRNRLEIRLDGGALFNPALGAVLFQGQRLQLTSQERRFLNYLLQHRGTSLPVKQIHEHQGFKDRQGLAALRNLVYRLRAKIGPRAVISRRDEGYMAPHAHKDE
jgi:DNA-binding response OmpR family regulator